MNIIDFVQFLPTSTVGRDNCSIAYNGGVISSAAKRHANRRPNLRRACSILRILGAAVPNSKGIAHSPTTRERVAELRVAARFQNGAQFLAASDATRRHAIAHDLARDPSNRLGGNLRSRAGPRTHQEYFARCAR